jgi:hypothetical protein
MRRIRALDGLRGYFLIVMLLNHLGFEPRIALQHLTRVEFVLGVDAQGFVFLSGLLAGLVYTTHLKRHGFAAAAGRMRRRALEIYGYAFCCLAVVLALALTLPGAPVFWGSALGALATPTPAAVAAAAAFLVQPPFLDILAQYVLYLLVAPPLVRWAADGRWFLVTGLSLLCWVGAQLGAGAPIVAVLNAGLDALQPGLRYESYFNPFGWQITFMTGLVLGTLTASGRIDWRRLMRPDRPASAIAAACLVAAVVSGRWLIGNGYLPSGSEAVWEALTERRDLGPILVLNFAALAWLVGWLLMAGREARLFGARPASRLLHRLLDWSFLRLLGRHSLQVFAYHAVLVYLLIALDWYLGPWSEPTETVTAFLAMASLALPALLHESMLVRQRAQASVAAERSHGTGGSAPAARAAPEREIPGSR